ncbi:MAG TPA: Gfo/Idh/MocA family oxidoreductase, partial [Bryobacteraceae bacterium]|nr:Gfo/Idh/MocA family oxidoreductase [Bryobacteraceae bacterium]
MPDDRDPTRRDFVMGAGAAMAASTASAASSRVSYGVIGTGGQGCYLLGRMARLAGCRCVAVADVYEPNLKRGVAAAGSRPQAFTDYRKLLDRKDVEAVVVATPLSTHFPITRDALEAGKHVFCEPPLVFKREEIQALRALAEARPNQVIQVGLQRRYSRFYQIAKLMVSKG